MKVVDLKKEMFFLSGKVMIDLMVANGFLSQGMMAVPLN